MRLKEIMSTEVETVRPGETLARARARMDLRGIHQLVVVDRRKVVGILTRELLDARAAEGVARVGDAMRRHTVTATPEMTIKDAANLLRGRALRALPIVSEAGLQGIVTVTDLLALLGTGVDRPAKGKRWTLRDRGVKPRRQQPTTAR